MIKTICTVILNIFLVYCIFCTIEFSLTLGQISKYNIYRILEDAVTRLWDKWGF